MAQQPDIAAILAALNSQQSQRPDNTPNSASNPTASALPFSTSPSGNLPAPSSSGTVSLPPPSNSGNFDLSSVKPTQSGTVSLADAIAKAQGIAAEKGRS